AAYAEAFDECGDVIARGDEDDGDVRGERIGFEAAASFEAVHFGHHDVEEDHFWLQARGDGERGGARGDGGDGVAVGFEEIGEDGEVCGGVVDGEDGFEMSHFFYSGKRQLTTESTEDTEATTPTKAEI